ncbi:hypothetical protein Fmac_006000 [Flemingia macrophylla]|uniref:Cytochrome P450 n=1 Tax=Flemingia macrophylla TaxID=520843 RepID=A0ABD1N9D9_9FABA
MDAWWVILVSLCVGYLMTAIFKHRSPLSTAKRSIPPGPTHIPIISSILWLRKSFSELEPILRTLRAKYGPIITLRIGSHPYIFISDRSLAHRALIHHASVFSHRPKDIPTGIFFNNNQLNISSTSYGPTWRTLRRNLTSEMLHPSRVISFSGTRRWVLQTLLTRLKSDSQSNPSVLVIDHFRYAMFCLLVFMCFGETPDDATIADIERVQRQVLVGYNRFSILGFWPTVTRVLFRKRWQEFLGLKKDKEDVLLPLVRAMKQKQKQKQKQTTSNYDAVSYVDTLLDLQLPEEKRKLDEVEVMTLCSEFLDGGTDTTSTALQWIMANLVKYPHAQERLMEEIRQVVGEREEREVKEDDLHKLSYLKAVVLEGLRRHPPGHFVLPHVVSEDVVLNDYLVPKNGTVNFMVAEMGVDPKVWEDPLAFKPERFLSDEGFDITGTKEIKMMPFGVGRRICPGYNLALLHLEYFVANLVLNFEWKVPEGRDVDLSEKQEFTVVMKNPLHVHISPRI